VAARSGTVWGSELLHCDLNGAPAQLPPYRLRAVMVRAVLVRAVMERAVMVRAGIQSENVA
jgi:hypothetical protein